MPVHCLNCGGRFKVNHQTGRIDAFTATPRCTNVYAQCPRCRAERRLFSYYSLELAMRLKLPITLQKRAAIPLYALRREALHGYAQPDPDPLYSAILDAATGQS
jgi:hypothetical protein